MSESTVRNIKSSESQRGEPPVREGGPPAVAAQATETGPPADLQDGAPAESVPPAAAPGANISPHDATVITDRSPERVDAPSGGAAPSDLGRMLEGERLDHFELDKFIGGGGMGAVFRGTDTALGRPVAIKVLLTHYASDEETVRRFQNEAQSVARLDHENIARVYYVGEDRGWHYIVLEFIEGENLRDRVHRQGPLPLAEVVSYTLQIAEALAHASSRDVVHRDIKPSNVLVTAEGQAKLVDMGLARLHQVEHSNDDLTASGVTLGTFDYISPEQARDPRTADVRSDLYSLGCSFYFMLTGRPPFPEGTVLQKLLQHQGDEPPDPRQFRSQLPEQVCVVAHKLLAKNPEDRYQEPNQLVADLLIVADQLKLPGPVTQTSVWLSAPPEPTTWSNRHLPWLVPLGLLCAIGAMIHYTSPRGPSPVSSPPKLVAAPAAAGTSARLVRTPAADGASSAPGANSAAKSPALETAPKASAKASASDSTIDNAGSRPGKDQAKTVDPPVNKGDEITPENGGNGKDVASAALEPPDVTPVAATPRTNGDEPLLIVTDDPKQEGEYTTLADACRDASSGDVIELRFDGRRVQAEQPIAIADRKLTIRAGEGFQPIIWFRPAGPDRVFYPRSMIHVAGGELLMSNVHLELDLPVQVRSDNWSLFEAILADRIRLTRCTMTIRNANTDLGALYENVSFFHIKAPPRRVRTIRVEDQTSSARLHLDLRDCVARGEATFLRGTALDTVQLQWENGLVAISETFVDLEGQTAGPPALTRLEIDLKHVTCLSRNGFCRMVSREDQRHLPVVRVDCADSILMTTDAALFQQTGVQTDEEFKQHVLWNADHNFYENISSFWRIDSGESPEVYDMDWSTWQGYWGPGRERLDRPLPVLWKSTADAERPLHEHFLDAYLLDESKANPARAAATDGMSDVGMLAAQLPSPPAHEPESAPSVEEDAASE
ncbi:MAG: serine/threonine protein kinase [Planctomycetota bacterium]|nr:serine/threonine protein kinase [Planctomycetota bacterium]